VQKAMRDPALKEKLAEQGIVVVGNTPDEFQRFVVDEVARWAKVIKDANIKMPE
jgi:tripartite-type tricarboxylate transporter receptor subunit TctC